MRTELQNIRARIGTHLCQESLLAFMMTVSLDSGRPWNCWRTEISRKCNSANIFWSTESLNVCIKFITKLNFGWKLFFVSSTYDQLMTSQTWHDALFLVVNVHSFSSIFGLYLLWTTTAFLKTQTFFAFTDSGPRGIKFLLSVNLNPSCCPAQSPVRKTSSRFISGVLSAHL